MNDMKYIHITINAQVPEFTKLKKVLTLTLLDYSVIGLDLESGQTISYTTNHGKPRYAPFISSVMEDESMSS